MFLQFPKWKGCSHVWQMNIWRWYPPRIHRLGLTSFLFPRNHPTWWNRSNILLMEEIRLTTWDVQNLVTNGINYQPQLVSRNSSINSITVKKLRCLASDVFASQPFWTPRWSTTRKTAPPKRACTTNPYQGRQGCETVGWGEVAR